MLYCIVSIMAFCMMAVCPAAALSKDFSYAQYEILLKRSVKTGVTINGIPVNAVDYTGLAADAQKPDSPYSLLLKQLAAFDPATLDSSSEQMAFWINVYNIAAIKTILDHYPVESIRSRKIHWLGLPWSRKAITVGGREYSLEEIEFSKLVIGFKDLRVHFGINCASVSCVDLPAEPFRAQTLDKQLAEQTKRFLASREKGLRIDRTKNAVVLSQIFKFDKKHFDEYANGALRFILPYLAPEEQSFLQTDTVTVEYLDYNWNLNDLKNVR